MKSFFKTVLAVIGCAIGLSASGQGITRNLMTTNSDPTVRTILTNIANQAANIATNQLAKANTNNFVKKGGDVMTGPLAIKSDDVLGALKVATSLSNSWITIMVFSNAGGPQGDITGPAGQSIGFNAGGIFGISDSGDEIVNMDPGSQSIFIGTFGSSVQFFSANGTGPKAVFTGPVNADLSMSTNYPVATGATAGTVKPDGVTTSVDVNGVITAVTGSATSTNTPPPSITGSSAHTVLYSSAGGTNNYWTNAPVISGVNITGVTAVALAPGTTTENLTSTTNFYVQNGATETSAHQNPDGTMIVNGDGDTFWNIGFHAVQGLAAFSLTGTNGVAVGWAGNFSGNGSPLTNLNASALSSGTVAPARMGTNVQNIAGANMTITTQYSGGVLSYTYSGTASGGSSNLTDNGYVVEANNLTVKTNANFLGTTNYFDGDVGFGGLADFNSLTVGTLYTSLTNSQLLGTGANGELAAVSIGTGLSLVGGVLTAPASGGSSNIVDAGYAIKVPEIYVYTNLYVSNNAAGLSATLQSDGYFNTVAGMKNLTTGDNGALTVGTAGPQITRNTADSAPALLVNNAHASSTGNILTLQHEGATKASVDKDGNVTAASFVGSAYATNLTGRAYYTTNVLADVSVPDASRQYQDAILTTGTNVAGFANLISGIKSVFSVCYSNSIAGTAIITNPPTAFAIGPATTNQMNLPTGKQGYWTFDIIPGVRTNYMNAQ